MLQVCGTSRAGKTVITTSGYSRKIFSQTCLTSLVSDVHFHLLRRRANALGTLDGNHFTSSTQLINPNYLIQNNIIFIISSISSNIQSYLEQYLQSFASINRVGFAFENRTLWNPDYIKYPSTTELRELQTPKLKSVARASKG